MINARMGGAQRMEAMDFEALDGSRTRFIQTPTFDTTDFRDEVLLTVETGALFTYSRLDRVLARPRERRTDRRTTHGDEEDDQAQ